MQRIAQTTQFNGQNILDGTFSSAQFQVGANANQIDLVRHPGRVHEPARRLPGDQQRRDDQRVRRRRLHDQRRRDRRVGRAPAPLASPADSATAKATAINSKANLTGVTATATNYVAGRGARSRVRRSRAASLTINGVAIGAVAADANAVTQGRNAATAINAVTNQTGVSRGGRCFHGRSDADGLDGRNINLDASGRDGRRRPGDPERHGSRPVGGRECLAATK